jgi:four helix bundle protein
LAVRCCVPELLSEPTTGPPGEAASRAEFGAKIGIVLEEADETVYWLELLVEGGLVAEKRMADLLREAEELVKIFATMKGTLRNQRPR